MGYKVKKIMLGTQQVRPERNYEYNINFKDYSNISQVQALGWSFYSAESRIVPAVNQTYGFYNSNYQNVVWYLGGIYNFGQSLSTAKKVILNVSGYGASNVYKAGRSFIRLGDTINTGRIWGNIRFGEQGQTDCINLNGSNGSNIWVESIGSGSSYMGAFTITLEIDLENKLAKYTSTGKSLSGTKTLSDSDITLIRSFSNLGIETTAYNGSAVNNQIWSASIKIR